MLGIVVVAGIAVLGPVVMAGAAGADVPDPPGSCTIGDTTPLGPGVGVAVRSGGVTACAYTSRYQGVEAETVTAAYPLGTYAVGGAGAHVCYKDGTAADPDRQDICVLAGTAENAGVIGGHVVSGNSTAVCARDNYSHYYDHCAVAFSTVDGTVAPTTTVYQAVAVCHEDMTGLWCPVNEGGPITLLPIYITRYGAVL